MFWHGFLIGLAIGAIPLALVLWAVLEVAGMRRDVERHP